MADQCAPSEWARGNPRAQRRSSFGCWNDEAAPRLIEEEYPLPSKLWILCGLYEFELLLLAKTEILHATWIFLLAFATRGGAEPGLSSSASLGVTNQRAAGRCHPTFFRPSRTRWAGLPVSRGSNWDRGHAEAGRLPGSHRPQLPSPARPSTRVCAPLPFSSNPPWHDLHDGHRLLASKFLFAPPQLHIPDSCQKHWASVVIARPRGPYPEPDMELPPRDSLERRHGPSLYYVGPFF